MGDIGGLFVGMTGAAILLFIFLYLLGIFLLIFWLAMLISAGSKNQWFWFTIMILALITGIGQFIVAILYYFIVHKKHNKKNKATKKKPKSKRREKNSNGLYVLIVLLIIFLLVLCGVLLVQLNLVDNPIKEINLEPQLFNIRDECTMILGNLIHKIKDAEGCELSCKTECGVRDMDFHSSYFIESDADCHVCRCYCI